MYWFFFGYLIETIVFFLLEKSNKGDEINCYYRQLHHMGINRLQHHKDILALIRPAIKFSDHKVECICY